MQKLYDPAKPFNEQIREIIRATHSDEGPIRVLRDGKRFRTEVDPSYVASQDGSRYVDGIGTKGKLHWEMDTVEAGVRDAVAMVFDDAIESGRVPVELVDHLILQEEDQGKLFRIIKTLSDLCVEHSWSAGGKTYPVAITAGETAILNTIEGFELGIVATAYARKHHTIPTGGAKSGYVVIGIESSGIHSNGLSFFREEFFNNRGMTLDTELSWGTTVGKELTIPTRIYLPALKALINQFEDGGNKASASIGGMVHITGGGLAKLKELIPKGNNLDVIVTSSHGLNPQEIFQFVHAEFNVPSDKMYTRFNNGIGYVVVVDRSKEENTLETLNKYFKAETIGRVVDGTGKVIIESKYEPITVIY